MSGLPNERHAEIVQALTERFRPQAPLHKVKGRARGRGAGPSIPNADGPATRPRALTESERALASELEIKVKNKVKVKVKGYNLNAKERLFPNERELHKVILAKYGAVKPQYLKDGITIFRLDGYLCNAKELNLPYPNDVFAAHVFLFAMGQKGRWGPGSYMLELKKGELDEISKATEHFDGQLPMILAVWRYGQRRFPKFCVALIPDEIEAEYLAGKLERDIIQEVPEFKQRQQEREYRRTHRTRAQDDSSTRPESGSER